MVQRPCIGCGRLIPHGTRCVSCTRNRTWAERTRRRTLVAQWVGTHGNICPGWERDPHPAHDLTADHVYPVSLGYPETGALSVLCNACNARKGQNVELR